MPTALIIGASRGIGLEMVRQYRADGWRVIATARKEEDSVQLLQLGAETLLLDVSDAAQCIAFGSKLDGELLNVAILNAGISGPRKDARKAPSEADFDAVMHTNVLAAMRLLPVIAPCVGAAHGKLAVISSNMGSLTGRANSGASLYRASKAALNSVLLDVALEAGSSGATCLAVHPGWVRTDMGGADADISVQDSVAGIRSTLATATHVQNGAFLNYDGTPLGW